MNRCLLNMLDSLSTKKKKKIVEHIRKVESSFAMQREVFCKAKVVLIFFFFNNS